MIPKRGRGKTSMLVCNHIGFLEIIGIKISNLKTNFAPKAELGKAPILGTILKALGSFFIERGATKDRDAIVNQIMER